MCPLQQSRGYLASSGLSSSYSGYSGGTTRPLTSLEPGQHRPLTAGTLEHGQHGSHAGQSSVLASAGNGSVTGAHLPPSARHTPTLMSSSLPSGIGNNVETGTNIILPFNCRPDQHGPGRRGREAARCRWLLSSGFPSCTSNERGHFPRHDSAVLRDEPTDDVRRHV